MKISRREVTKILLAAVVAPPGLAASAASQAAGAKTWDVAVIGAGAFGAWSAYWLRKAGLHVILLDAYGAANSRASSGGESRIIRAAYGEHDFYSRWAMHSLPQWKELAVRCGQEIFYETGVLSFSDDSTDFVAQSGRTLERIGIMHKRLGAAELARRFPQIGLKGNEVGILEPRSGALMARRGVQVLVEELVRQGLDYRVAAATPPSSKGRLSSIATTGNETISAGVFVFACGPWLPKIFPELLGSFIQPERAEVYFLGVAPGDSRFSSPQMPTWIYKSKDVEAYGMPVLENRGFKVAVDKLSLPADPDTMDREPTPPYRAQLRAFVAERFPALKDAPVIETRVCQYENTETGNYLVDRHPEMENVWIVGGGSGHGFKNGPAMGEYVASVVFRGVPLEKVFMLGYKPKPGHLVE
ncbi:MAG TPA: FAD-dependent oxidoreductase [Candidatus Acidoferrales bacterium]|nr:FAD-dependent oxidoreductase [Candidatus Acidoferrales bacterium]